MQRLLLLLSSNYRGLPLTDLLRESDFWAEKDSSDTVNGSHVEKAIAEHLRRGSKIRERSLEAIERETLLVSTSGEKTGQINGLSVMQLGSTSFGRPSRITARVSLPHVTRWANRFRCGQALFSSSPTG